MLRDVTFWKVFVSSIGIAGLAALISFQWDNIGDSAVLFGILLLAAATLQSWWMHKRMRDLLAALRTTVAAWDDPLLTQPVSPRLASEFQELLQPLHLAGGRLKRQTKCVERLAEEHAQRSELLQAVLATVVEGVIVVDSDEQVLFANETAQKLLDVNAREVLNRPLWEVTRSTPIHEAVQSVLMSEEDVLEEVVMPRSKSVVSLTVTALPHDPVPGAVLVLRDMTALRKLESMRRDFVTNVSHELKTPLTSIQAYADTLLNDPETDREQEEYFLSRIVSESERLHHIILDLIRLGRIESQADDYEVQEVAVGAVVSACLEDHRAVAEGKSIHLQSVPSAEPLSVLADADELRTILDNLVDNAIKYTDSDGHVLVRWQHSDDMGIIEVQDDGAGIPLDRQPRVFERFYRVDKARDRERGGTGLGLSIVKHLCQMFGGSVEVDSEMGQGSTFRVRLPLAGTQGPETASDSSSALAEFSTVPL